MDRLKHDFQSRNFQFKIPFYSIIVCETGQSMQPKKCHSNTN